MSQNTTMDLGTFRVSNNMDEYLHAIKGLMPPFLLTSQTYAAQTQIAVTEVDKRFWTVGKCVHEVLVVAKVGHLEGPFYVDIFERGGKVVNPSTYTVTPTTYPAHGLPSFLAIDRWVMYPGHKYLITFNDSQNPVEVETTSPVNPPMFAPDLSMVIPSSSGAVKYSPPEPPSHDEIKFNEVVTSLLASKHTHSDLKQRLWKLVMEEARKLPPIKILLCCSFGVFSLSRQFEAFRGEGLLPDPYEPSARSDPALIQSITSYGRFICEKCPHILHDMRTFRHWDLDNVLRSIPQKRMATTVWYSHQCIVETDPDLLSKAEEFFDEMSNGHNLWRQDRLEVRVCDDFDAGNDLVAFAELHPDFWMCHQSFLFGDDWLSDLRFGIRFAHILRHEDVARYQVKPDETRDTAIYEYIGLLGASTQGCKLGIEEIPDLVDYEIEDHGGLEEVKY